MKKMFFVTFCLALSLVFVGCSSNTPAEDKTSRPEIIEQPASTEEGTAAEPDPLVIDLEDEALPFVSVGEAIAPDGPDAWLLAGVTEGNAPIKADLRLLESRGVGVPTAAVNALTGASVYELKLKTPDQIFNADAVCAARVFYPSEVAAGEKGVIAVIVETIDDYAYCASVEFEAKDDIILKNAPADTQPKILYGGDSLSVTIYTADQPLTDENFFELADEQYGDLFVEFVDIEALDSDE